MQPYYFKKATILVCPSCTLWSPYLVCGTPLHVHWFLLKTSIFKNVTTISLYLKKKKKAKWSSWNSWTLQIVRNARKKTAFVGDYFQSQLFWDTEEGDISGSGYIATLSILGFLLFIGFVDNKKICNNVNLIFQDYMVENTGFEYGFISVAVFRHAFNSTSVYQKEADLAFLFKISLTAAD